MIKKRLFTILLSCCMVLTTLPTVAFADDYSQIDPNERETVFHLSDLRAPSAGGGSSGWIGDYVYFGHDGDTPMKFRVLDKSTTDFSENTGERTMLLDCNNVLYNQNYDVAWNESTIRANMNTEDFLNEHFSDAEKKSIASSKKTRFSEDDWKSYEFMPLNGDRLFALDVGEAFNTKYGYETSFEHRKSYIREGMDVLECFWLRTKSNANNSQMVGAGNFEFWSAENDRIIHTSDAMGVSPALNVLHSEVLFAVPIRNYDGTRVSGEYKLELFDDNTKFSRTDDPVIREGNQITVPCEVETEPGGSVYISIMILDKKYEPGKTENTNILYYGAADADEDLLTPGKSAKGKISFTLPDEFADKRCGTDYFIYAFVEKISSDQYESDYASALCPIAVPSYRSAINIGTVRSAHPLEGGWNLGDGAQVYFGDNIYRVLASNPETQATTGNGILLDCDECIDNQCFDTSTNVWSKSNIRKIISEEMPKKLSEVEQGAVLSTTLKGQKPYAEHDVAFHGSCSYQDEESIDKYFLLSVKEVLQLYMNPTARNKKGGGWWLRSADGTPSASNAHTNVGRIENGELQGLSSEKMTGVSPALNLDVSRIFLTTAASVSKRNPIQQDTAVYEWNTDHPIWQLTLYDEGKIIQRPEGKVATLKENTVTLPYFYTDTAEDASASVNQISVMITDKPYTEDAKILYYGALVNIKDEEGNPSDISKAKKGTGTFEIPMALQEKKIGKDYYLYAIAEHISGEKKTDYASIPCEYIGYAGSMGYTLPKAEHKIRYTGNPWTLEEPGVAPEGCTLSYQVGGGEWTTELPVITKAGDYNIAWKICSDADGKSLFEGNIHVAACGILLLDQDGNEKDMLVDVQQAFDRVEDCGTVKLISDSTTNDKRTITIKKNITLDLNGKTLRASAGGGIIEFAGDYNLNIRGEGRIKGSLRPRVKCMTIEDNVSIDELSCVEHELKMVLRGGTFGRLDNQHNQHSFCEALPEESYVIVTGDGRVYRKKDDLRNATNAKVIRLEEDEHILSFDTGGGSIIMPIIQKSGTRITSPQDPTRKNYSFSGWEPGVPETMPDKDLKITAKWTKLDCEHTGGRATCTTQAICTICDEPYGNLDPDNHTKGKEWLAIDANSHVQKYICCGAITAREMHQCEDGSCAKCGHPCEDIYILTFDSNGGVGTMHSQNFRCGEEGKLDANAFSREGYTFDGWNTKPNGSGDAYHDSATLSITDDVTLYAMWFDDSQKCYNVTVSANCDGMQVSADIAKGITGTRVRLTAEESKRVNDQELKFSYWKVCSGDVTVIDNDFVIGTKDVHIKAMYTEVFVPSLPTRKVTYNTNCGEFTSEYDTVSGLSSFTVRDCMGLNPGYTFVAWNTKADGSGITLKPEQKVQIHSDLKLYAIWKKSDAQEYEINVIEGRATAYGEEIERVTEGTVVTLTANTVSGESYFDKWVVESGNITLSGINRATTSFQMPAGAVTVRATYKDLSHTHDFSLERVKHSARKTSANCAEDAVYYKSCSVCGEVSNLEADVFTAAGTAFGHTASDWIIDTQPTATTDGTKHKECTICKATLEQATIPATGGGSSGGGSTGGDSSGGGSSGGGSIGGGGSTGGDSSGGGSTGGGSTVDPGKPGADNPNPGGPTVPVQPIDPSKPGTETDPAEPAGDTATNIAKGKAITADLNLVARSSKTSKKNIKVVLKADAKTKASIKELQDLGFTVKYRFYRSTKKAAGYKAAVTKKTATYTNTSGKNGTKYYYKIQIRVHDEKGKLIAKTALKQCKYASRTWSK